MGMKRGGIAVALTACALLLLAWAVSADPPRFTGELSGPDLGWGTDDQPPEPSPLPTEELPEETELPEEWETPGWLQILFHVLGWLVGAAACVGAIYVLFLILRGLMRRRGPQAPDNVAVLDFAARATGEQTQQRAATEGSPRNAVVACWVALEDAAEGAGLHRPASETSEEFTVRVLDHWDVDPGTVTELAQLYRTARFSRLELSEEHRIRAITALERVHNAILERRAAEEAAKEAARQEREQGWQRHQSERRGRKPRRGRDRQRGWR